jgi:hypothetical protein
MKNSYKRSFFLSFPLQMAAMACLLSSGARADETWGGGTDQWDVANTPDWSGATWTEGYDTGSGTITNPGDVADFTTAGGTVTVDDTQPGGSVAATYLYFNNGNNGAYTLTGNTIYTDDGYGGNMIHLDSNSGAVTINNTVQNVGADNQFIVNNSANDLVLNGDISYNNQTTLFMGANGAGRSSSTAGW